MTKRLASKHKVDRRLKANLWGRPKSPFNTRNYKPGQHGKTSKGKISDYGTQLQAKQKLKFYYGNMNERQFRNVYRKALQKKGNTTENFINEVDFVSIEEIGWKTFEGGEENYWGKHAGYDWYNGDGFKK